MPNKAKGLTQASADLRSAAVAMAARGKTNVAIAKALDVDDSTVSQWRQEPAFRAAMEVELDRIRASLDAAMAPMVGKALGRYEQVLDEGKDREAVTVARDVLDRQYGRALQREERQTRADIHVTVSYVHSRDKMQVVDSTSIPVEQEDKVDSAPLNVTALRDRDGNERGIVLADTEGVSPLSRWIEVDDD